ncbi:hypothetical protein MTR_2g025770 [Medicago truncatula]|uniref:Uncharacterized protein n=1 Tax=Medicago truncatula TaxID=3880 RepID=G7IM23_MEDTR|nr:hypothetical protein MTR_2g025770 [Medicago truncatula]
MTYFSCLDRREVVKRERQNSWDSLLFSISSTQRRKGEEMALFSQFTLWCVWFRREVGKREINEREYGKRERDEK